MTNLTHMISILNLVFTVVFYVEINKTKFYLHKFLNQFN
jgi:hypothetical protein